MTLILILLLVIALVYLIFLNVSLSAENKRYRKYIEDVLIPQVLTNRRP